MGYLAWTKAWSALDNGTVLTGVHLGTLQSDIAAVLNGGISDANIATLAAILESKLAFNVSTGHNHDGSNSRLIAGTGIISTQARFGGGIHRASAGTLTVDPFSVTIGGNTRQKTTATTLTLATIGDYIFGSEGASAPHYVYTAYHSTDGLLVKLSTEAPDLSDTSDNTAELPLRYQKYTYNGEALYWRCLGQVYNNAASDIEAGRETSFDLTWFAHGKIADPSADITVSTIWTPRHVRIWVPVDATPATTERATIYETTKDYQADNTLNIEHGVNATNEHRQMAAATAGAVKTITTQAAGTAGGFVVTTTGGATTLYWMAWGDGS